jgi:predicted negative regulator of RcsB-dependent stress response
LHGCFGQDNLHQLKHSNKENQMFLTIGFIIGFAAGWWVNEKVEDLGEKINPIKWFKK